MIKPLQLSTLSQPHSVQSFQGNIDHLAKAIDDYCRFFSILEEHREAYRIQFKKLGTAPFTLNIQGARDAVKIARSTLIRTCGQQGINIDSIIEQLKKVAEEKYKTKIPEDEILLIKNPYL